MDASGGSREEKDDDHQNNRGKRDLDRIGFKNVEGSDEKSLDEVPQSSDQMEVVEDVEENSNAEFIESQIDIRGSVGVVGGQFGNELVHSSDNSDVWNQRMRSQGQNTGNTGSSSHGTALDHGNLLGQSTSGTQLVLHSESSIVLGQGQGGGTGSVWHSESSSRNVHGQGGQQGMHSQSVTPTTTQYQRGRFTVTHEQPSAISGVSRPRGAHEHNVRPEGPLAQSGSDTHTYQRGRFRETTYQQPSANPGFFAPRAVQEHNMRVQSDHNIAGQNVPRPRGPAVQLGSDRHTYQRGRFAVTHEQPSAISGVSRPRGGNDLRPRGQLTQSGSDTHTYQHGTRFFMPQSQNTGNTGSSNHGTASYHGNLLGQSTSGTQLVVHSESSSVLGQAQGQGTDGTGSVLHSESSNGHAQSQEGMYSQSVTPAATQYQRGRFTVTHEQPSDISGVSRPRSGVYEHNVRVWSDPNIASRNMRVQSDANMVHANMFTQGTLQMSQQIGFFGYLIYPFFPTVSTQHAGLPVARPPVQSGTGFYMPRARRVQEHNTRVRSEANMARANMFRQGTPQMSQQIGSFGTPTNPSFPTLSSQNAGVPVARPPVQMAMSNNADMAVEAGDRGEVVSDQGSSTEDS